MNNCPRCKQGGPCPECPKPIKPEWRPDLADKAYDGLYEGGVQDTGRPAPPVYDVEYRNEMRAYELKKGTAHVGFYSSPEAASNAALNLGGVLRDIPS